jgi:hypothetical protein
VQRRPPYADHAQNRASRGLGQSLRKKHDRVIAGTRIVRLVLPWYAQPFRGHVMPIFFYLPLIVWTGFVEAACATAAAPVKIKASR